MYSPRTRCNKSASLRLQQLDHTTAVDISLPPAPPQQQSTIARQRSVWSADPGGHRPCRAGAICAECSASCSADALAAAAGDDAPNDGGQGCYAAQGSSVPSSVCARLSEGLARCGGVVTGVSVARDEPGAVPENNSLRVHFLLHYVCIVRSIVQSQIYCRCKSWLAFSWHLVEAHVTMLVLVPVPSDVTSSTHSWLVRIARLHSLRHAVTTVWLCRERPAQHCCSADVCTACGRGWKPSNRSGAQLCTQHCRTPWSPLRQTCACG